MADIAHPGGTGGTRRDFLTLTTIAVGAVGAASLIWPLVDSMNPAADALAVASTEIDISKIDEGQRVTFVYRGKPVFVAHRTAAEIEEVRKVPLSDLIDPETDQARVKKPEWLVVIGVCTHLGCVPLGQKATDPRGDWGGYFCPCHGSQYDTSGRVRHGPAPANLAVPTYAFSSDSLIKVG